MRDPARFLFFIRNHLAGAPLLWVLFTSYGESEPAVASWTAALLVCGAGVALRAWSSCHCNYARGRPMHLASTGPYALVRNPLYLGNILIILGAAIASQETWLIPVSLIWSSFVYAMTVATYEEHMMRARYGDAWLRYAASVPAWIPALHRVRLKAPPFLGALAPQTLRLLWLLPFLLKELHLLGIGSRK